MEKTNCCGHDRRYSEEYDSFYCPICMNWLEKKCKDPDCEFCRKRPDKPEQNNG